MLSGAAVVVNAQGNVGHSLRHHPARTRHLLAYYGLPNIFAYCGR